MFARMGQIKQGRLVDPETEEDLSNVETALRGQGIELRSTNDEFRNFGEVLDEVAGRWNSWSDTSKRAIANAFGVTRQQEKFLVLMENYDDAMRLAGVSADSSGTALEKFQVVQEGIEARLNALKSSWQELSASVIDSGFVKWVVTAGKDILNVFTALSDNLGILPTALGLGGLVKLGANLGLTRRLLCVAKDGSHIGLPIYKLAA